MTKCDYCKDKGQVGNPEMPDSCPYCGPERDVAFGVDTAYGEWDAVATKWKDGWVTVEVSQDAGCPYATIITSHELLYRYVQQVTPQQLAWDIEARCEP